MIYCTFEGMALTWTDSIVVTPSAASRSWAASNSNAQGRVWRCHAISGGFSLWLKFIQTCNIPAAWPLEMTHAEWHGDMLTCAFLEQGKSENPDSSKRSPTFVSLSCFLWGLNPDLITYTTLIKALQCLPRWRFQRLLIFCTWRNDPIWLWPTILRRLEIWNHQLYSCESSCETSFHGWFPAHSAPHAFLQ